MQLLWQDLSYNARILWTKRWTTAIAILCLGMSLGANSIFYTLGYAFIWKPLPIPDPDSLVRIVRSGTSQPQEAVMSFEEYHYVRGALNSASAVGAFVPAQVTFSLTAASAEVSNATRHWAHLVTDTYFETVGLSPIQGRTFSDDPADGDTVVISHRVWVSYLSSGRRGLGETIWINNRPLTVIGVMPKGTFGTERIQPADFWIPIASLPRVRPVFGNPFKPPGTRLFQILGRLKHHISLENAQAEASTLRLPQAGPTTDTSHLVSILPDGHAALSHLRPLTLLLAVSSAFILLIGCVNVLHLQLAHWKATEREMAIRQSLGAAWLSVIRLMAVGNILLFCIGTIVSLVFAEAALAITRHAAPALGTTDYYVLQGAHIDLRVGLTTAALAGVAALITTLVPAVRLRRANIVTTLRSDPFSQPSSIPLLTPANLLLSFQLATTFVLLSTASSMIQAFRTTSAVQATDGIKAVVLLSIDPRMTGVGLEELKHIYMAILDRVRSVPGVTSATLAHDALAITGPTQRVAATHEGCFSADPSPRAQINVIASDYFRTIGQLVISGRGVADYDNERAEAVVVINRALASRVFGDTPTLSRTLWLCGGTRAVPHRVIGFVDAAPLDTLFIEPRLTCYLPFRQAPAKMDLLVRLHRVDDQHLRALRSSIAEVAKDVPLLRLRTLDRDIAERLTDGIQVVGSITISLGLLAILLAGLGLFGVMSHYSSRKTKDMAIRLAVGASPKDLALAVLKRGLVLCVVGVSIGVICAAGLSRLIENQLVGYASHSGNAFWTTSSVVVLAGLFASVQPAWRAACIDVAALLRSD